MLGVAMLGDGDTDCLYYIGAGHWQPHRDTDWQLLSSNLGFFVE
jgi:hypothetical protein